MTEREAYLFINRYKWRFARTMPHIPHWYIRRSDCTGLGEDKRFNQFCRYIHFHGRPFSWGRQGIRPYLDMGGYRYWTMTPDVNITIIINREVIETSKAIPQDGLPRFEGVKGYDLTVFNPEDYDG